MIVKDRAVVEHVEEYPGHFFAHLKIDGDLLTRRCLADAAELERIAVTINGVLHGLRVKIVKHKKK